MLALIYRLGDNTALGVGVTENCGFAEVPAVFLELRTPPLPPENPKIVFRLDSTRVAPRFGSFCIAWLAFRVNASWRLGWSQPQRACGLL
jgi:hypothetical protein